MKVLSFLLGVILAIGGWFHHGSVVPPQVAMSVATSTAGAETQQVSPYDGDENSNPAAQGEAPASSDGSFMQGSNVQVSAPALPAGSPWQTMLPLGDNKFTTEGPQQGYIYLCNVMNGGQGAQEVGSWIQGSAWNLSEKPAVQGSVSWPDAQYSMTISGSTRLITSNDLPTDHPTGTFPISSTDPAYQIDRNPNSITAQQESFSLPMSPTPRIVPQCIYGQVGIMNDGVMLFDGFDDQNRDAVAREMQDAWDGHPDQDGTYHYHGFEDSVMKNTPVSTVVGFALDGYPITGGLLPDGNYLTSSDLDECHGITSTITLDGAQTTTYHYVLTQDFPYSVSCFHGTSNFTPPPPPQGQGKPQ